MQERLNSISIYYPVIPQIAADGIFGNATRQAVVTFQQLMGISADGIIGQRHGNSSIQSMPNCFTNCEIQKKSFTALFLIGDHFVNQRSPVETRHAEVCIPHMYPCCSNEAAADEWPFFSPKHISSSACILLLHPYQTIFRDHHRNISKK